MFTANNVEFFTGSIARRAKRRYLRYSQGIFRSFARIMRHIAQLRVKLCMEEWTLALIPCAIFTKFAQFVPCFMIRYLLKYGIC